MKGTAQVCFRHVITNKVIKITVSDKSLVVIDIPVGYTHNIINIGEEELITLMWSNEIFDPNKPDTYYEEV